MRRDKLAVSGLSLVCILGDKKLVKPPKTMEGIVEKDKRYNAEAYNFVMEALHFTVKKLDKPRHVSGQELLGGIREYALEQFGVMTRTLFEHWGVRRTEDFGEIVFNMVEAGLMGKTGTDSKDDFKNGYDFSEVFDEIAGYEADKNIG